MRQEIENMIDKFEQMNYARGFALGDLETYICLVGDGLIKKKDAISRLNGVLDNYEKMIISIDLLVSEKRNAKRREGQRNDNGASLQGLYGIY